VKENATTTRVLVNGKKIELHLKADANVAQRQKAFEAWYRRELRAVAAPLIEKWAKILKSEMPVWGIRRMKTKWGSCTIKSGRIWLNSEPAKKSTRCLEYVIVHELVHFQERHHNDRFVKLLDRHLPMWRVSRDELNAAPLRDENWR
jgi:predicted metal-dependent hydrolase